MKKFLKENKAAAIVLIVILGAIICFFYFSHQKAVKECKESCFYQTTSGVWNYEGKYKVESEEGFSLRQSIIQNLGVGWRSFPKQKQCIDYCLDQR